MNFLKFSQNEFRIPEITEQNITEIVNKIPQKKATGSDGLSAKFVKTLLTVLMPYLLLIFNKVITNGQYPMCWKIGRV